MIDRDRRIKILEDRNRELENRVNYLDGYVDCMKYILNLKMDENFDFVIPQHMMCRHIEDRFKNVFKKGREE